MIKLSPMIVIVGETASGKSQLALELAQKFDGELICADSWTVYRGFDIGTAKPTIQDQRLIRHHMLDIADPIDGYSAAVFQIMAQAVIKDITNKGKLPILVGGTGLYIDSVLYDYRFLPPPPVGMRSELDQMSIEELLVLAEHKAIDTAGIDLRNKRRIIRLIENNGVRPSKTLLRTNTLILGLQVPTGDLQNRIKQRVETMVSDGLMIEAIRLAATYGWDNEAMKGIGYAEWQSYAAGTQTLQETIDLITAHCCNLAKRQRTWFKRNKSIQWLSTPDKLSAAVDITTTFLR